MYILYRNNEISRHAHHTHTTAAVSIVGTGSLMTQLHLATNDNNGPVVEAKTGVGCHKFENACAVVYRFYLLPAYIID